MMTPWFLVCANSFMKVPFIEMGLWNGIDLG